MPPMLPARALAMVVLAAAAASIPAAGGVAPPALALDAERYTGRWYVIAHRPDPKTPEVGGFFEHELLGDGAMVEAYSARPGRFDQEPQVVRRTGHADPSNPARWVFRSGWFGRDEHLVLYVSPDYRFAIEGSGNGLWVLAREPEIAEWSYAGLLARLALRGYDVRQLRRMAQKPEQVGRPGFE